MPDSTQATGKRGQQAEDLARLYLQGQGLQLLERNYHCLRGEIDLIMMDKDSIVFVEVRYRRSERYGGGLESVDYHKRAKLIAAATHYLQRHKSAANYASRFDVIAVSPGIGQDKLEWIQDAFQT